MFKLQNVTLPDDYSSAQLAAELVRNVTYTFGDNIRITGVDIVPVADVATGSVDANECVICHSPDATLLVTEYTSKKLGVIPMTTAEANFVNAHAAVMADIAELLGYEDYVVYQYNVLDPETNRIRTVSINPNYNFATETGANSLEAWLPTSGSRGLYAAAGQPLALFARLSHGAGFAGDDLIVANAVYRVNTEQIRIPLNYYVTDMQNVQHAAMHSVIDNVSQIALKANADEVDAQLSTLTAALSSAVGLVGSLSVFGNTVKDVTDRYNNVTQYIPRP